MTSCSPLLNHYDIINHIITASRAQHTDDDDDDDLRPQLGVCCGCGRGCERGRSQCSAALTRQCSRRSFQAYIKR